MPTIQPEIHYAKKDGLPNSATSTLLGRECYLQNRPSLSISLFAYLSNGRFSWSPILFP